MLASQYWFYEEDARVRVGYILRENTKVAHDFVNLQYCSSSLNSFQPPTDRRYTELLQAHERLQADLNQLRADAQDMYLVMFKKGQQAANYGSEEVTTSKSTATATCTSGLTEEQATLRFLRDAVYYFVMNKDSSKDHLNAIMAILQFSEQQRNDVCRRKGGSL